MSTAPKTGSWTGELIYRYRFADAVPIFSPEAIQVASDAGLIFCTVTGEEMARLLLDAASQRLSLIEMLAKVQELAGGHDLALPIQ